MRQQLAVGQRVRVIDGEVPQFGQFGLVVAAGTSASWYVRLDDGAAERTFFQSEELEPVSPTGGV